MILLPPPYRYLVFCDPPGAKIGNGGATMHVLQELEQLLGWEKMKIGENLLELKSLLHSTTKKVFCESVIVFQKTEL